MKNSGMAIKSFIIFLVMFLPTQSNGEILNVNNWDDFSGWGSLNYVEGGASIVQLNDAPDSGHVLQFMYPKGFTKSGEPAKVWWVSPRPLKEFYLEYYFKYSSNYQFNTVADKITYIYSENRQSRVALIVFGSAHNLTVHIGGAGIPTWVVECNPEFAIGRDRWYKIKYYQKMNTIPGSGDGILKVWVDDILRIDRNNIMYIASGNTDIGFTAFDYAPVFGGAVNTKLNTDYLWIDKTKISTSTSNDPEPIGSKVPKSPTNLDIQ